MRSVVAVAALALLLAGGALVPVASAAETPPGFGRCELQWAAVAVYHDPVSGEQRDVEVPYGYECYW